MNNTIITLPIYGAICGDIIGSRFEGRYKKGIEDYPLIAGRCRITDDTVLTIGIAETLLRDDLQPRRIAHYLRKWGRRYPYAGYGWKTKRWLYSADPQPYQSYANGAAMRVSPCGVCAKTLNECLELARCTAEVSHNSEDGIRGAQAIASAIFLARNGSNKEQIRSYIETTFGYNLSQTMNELKASYEGFSCKAAITVPQSIIAFLESSDVESAIRNAISLKSDTDTMADMAGTIATAYYGEIPFLEQVLPLIPRRMLRILKELEKKLSGQEYNPLIDRNADLMKKNTNL